MCCLNPLRSCPPGRSSNSLHNFLDTCPSHLTPGLSWLTASFRCQLRLFDCSGLSCLRCWGGLWLEYRWQNLHCLVLLGAATLMVTLEDCMHVCSQLAWVARVLSRTG